MKSLKGGTTALLVIFLGLVHTLEAQQPIAAAPAATGATVEPPKSEPKMITVPAGTHVIMQLISPLDTESAVAGAGVYVETIFPVVAGDELAIPSHSYVTGTIEAEKRAGHVARAASFRMHFTRVTLAGIGKSSAIDGDLISLPGSTTARRDADSGKVPRVDQLDKALPALGAGAFGGAVLGSVRRLGIGTWTGAGIGTGLAVGAILLTRGDSLHLPEGTKVEMVLNAPLTVPASSPQGTPFQLQAASEQEKPAPHADAKSSPDSRRAQGKTVIGGLLTREILRGIWR